MNFKILFCLFIIISLQLFAQGSYNTTLLSRWLIYEGSVTSVDASGDTVYFASGKDLKIADFTDSSNPVILKNISYGSEITKVRNYGNYLVIHRENQCIKVLDVEDPMNAIEVWDFPDVAIRDFEIKISNDIVYLYLLYSTYFKTIIITDPNNPHQIVNFTVSSEGIRDWAFTQDYLCVIHGYWVKIIDIGDPANPEIVGEFNGAIDSNPESEYILAYNNIIYTTFNYTIYGPGGFYTWDQLNILDISNPSQPALVNTNRDIVWSRGIFSNDKAYIIDGNLHLYDLSDPENPLLFYTYYSDGDLSDLTILGNNAFAADGDNGVLKLDITNNPILVGHYFSEPLQPFITDVKKIGDYAYLIDPHRSYSEWGENKFRVIDVSDPGNPLQTDKMDLISEYFDVANEYAYFVAVENNSILKLHIVNVNDPYNLEETGSIDLEGNYIYDVNIEGNVLVQREMEFSN